MTRRGSRPRSSMGLPPLLAPDREHLIAAGRVARHRPESKIQIRTPGDRHLEEEAEAGRVDGSAVALSADGGYSGGRRWRHTGSRAPSAAHAAGAFLPRKASQEPDDLAHGRHRSGQIASIPTTSAEGIRKKLRLEMRGVFFAPSDFPPRPRAGIWKNRVAKNRVLM
jgi:hypothetical protein